MLHRSGDGLQPHTRTTAINRTRLSDRTISCLRPFRHRLEGLDVRVIGFRGSVSFGILPGFFKLLLEVVGGSGPSHTLHGLAFLSAGCEAQCLLWGHDIFRMQQECVWICFFTFHLLRLL